MTESSDRFRARSADTNQNELNNPDLYEQFRRLGRLWISSDFQTSESTIMQPNSTQYLKILFEKSKHLPPFDYDWTSPTGYGLNFLSLHTRSRAAQVALIVDGIDHYPWSNFLHQLQVSDKFETNMKVINIGPRLITINEGTGLSVFYNTMGAELLWGKKLTDELGLNISIEGTYGDDWMYIDSKIKMLDTHELNKATGVILKLKKQKYSLIPDVNPINPFTLEITSYRKYINNYLQALENIENTHLWIGETTSIMHIPEGYNGIINGYVISKIPLYTHIKSNLLIGGRTNWPIRVEIYNPAADNGEIEKYLQLVPRTQNVYSNLLHDHHADFMKTNNNNHIYLPTQMNPAHDKLQNDEMYIAINFFKDKKIQTTM